MLGIIYFSSVILRVMGLNSTKYLFYAFKCVEKHGLILENNEREKLITVLFSFINLFKPYYLENKRPC